MGLMKTLSLSSKELKDILDRLTALESGETFVTKETFNQTVESIEAGMNDIFSSEFICNSNSNITLNQSEIITEFKMTDDIDLSLYKSVFYVLVGYSSISYDNKLFEADLFLNELDGSRKLNVVNKSDSQQLFKIFIIKKGSAYVDLFDTIDRIILKAYRHMILYSGRATISAGGNYSMPIEISTAISPYSCSQCEIVSIASSSGVVDGTRPYFMSSDVTASVKKIANPDNATQYKYQVKVNNNASEALTTNTFVLASFDMKRQGR